MQTKEKPPVLCDGFSVEAELSIHALDKRLHIKNLTVGYRDRPAGSVSKLAGSSSLRSFAAGGKGS